MPTSRLRACRMSCPCSCAVRRWEKASHTARSSLACAKVARILRRRPAALAGPSRSASAARCMYAAAAARHARKRWRRVVCTSLASAALTSVEVHASSTAACVYRLHVRSAAAAARMRRV